MEVGIYPYSMQVNNMIKEVEIDFCSAMLPVRHHAHRGLLKAALPEEMRVDQS